jgi:hypothetical protein
MEYGIWNMECRESFTKKSHWLGSHTAKVTKSQRAKDPLPPKLTSLLTLPRNYLPIPYKIDVIYVYNDIRY